MYTKLMTRELTVCISPNLDGIFVRANINIPVFHVCCYVAVLPIIILCTKKENGYLAGVGISFFIVFVVFLLLMGN